MSTTMQETHYVLPVRGLFAHDDAAQHVVACVGGELWRASPTPPLDPIQARAACRTEGRRQAAPCPGA